MSFSESYELKDECRPLLRDPVWSNRHGKRYGHHRRAYDPEEMDKLLGLEAARNQKFQWILFLSVTLISVLLLFATLGFLIKLSEAHPSFTPTNSSSTLKENVSENVPNTATSDTSNSTTVDNALADSVNASVLEPPSSLNATI